MKVVIAHRTGTVHVVDLPETNLTRGCVAIRVSHSALNVPEELAQVAAMPGAGLKEDGRPIGSGVSGLVEAVGEDVRRLRAGLRVAAFGAPYVYHCERLVVPESLVVEIPKKVNHEEGAFVGQGAVAINMVRTSGCQLGETAIVFGADLIGIILVQVLRAAGVTPILVDGSEHRLNKARTVGAPWAHQEGDSDGLIRTVAAVTGGMGADAAFVTRANDARSLGAAAQLLREGGRVVLGARPFSAPLPGAFAERGLTMAVADDPGPGRRDAAFERHGHEYPWRLVRWNERENMACFAALLADRKVQLSPLVSDRTPIERATSIYEKAARSPETVVAAVLTI